MKNTMTEQFSKVFDLCIFVLSTYIENQDSNEGSVKKVLVKSTLNTFASFLSWIPYGYIFETDLIDKLTQNFFTHPSFRNDTLKCLVEIVGL